MKCYQAARACLRRCEPRPRYYRDAVIVAGVFGLILAGVVWFGSVPPASMVVLAEEVELVVAAESNLVTQPVTLDPELTLLADNAPNNARHTLRLESPCTRLIIAASQRPDGAKGVTVEPAHKYARAGGNEHRKCPRKTATLWATPGRGAPVDTGHEVPAKRTPHDISERALVLERAQAGEITADVRLRELLIGNVVEVELPPGSALANESLPGLTLEVRANEWRLKTLQIVESDGRALLRLALDQPTSITAIRLGGHQRGAKDVLLGWRTKTWWEWFWKVFGMATVLDVLKSRCLHRERPKKPKSTAGSTRAATS